MKKHLLFPLFFVLITVGATSKVWAKEFYMYSFEQRQILYMDDQSTTFSPGPTTVKNPDYMLKLNENNGFLAVFRPKDNKTPGQLVIHDTEGKIVDLVELGYYPFNWRYTKDRRHFFFSYKKTAASDQKKDGKTTVPDTYEILHYDAVEKTVETVPNLVAISDLELSADETQLLTLLQQKGQGQPNLTCISYSPFQIKSSLPDEKNAKYLYQLTPETVATVSFDGRSYDELGRKKREEGFVKLIDLTTNTVLSEHKLPAAKISLSHYKDKQILIIICGGWDLKNCMAKAVSDIIKLTPAGIQYFEEKSNWTDYDYLPENNTMYLLTIGLLSDHLKAINLTDGSSVEVKTGRNIHTVTSNSYKYFFRYRIYHFPESNFEIIHCPENGDIRFFDITTNKIAGDAKRSGLKARWSANNNASAKSQADLSTNAECSKFYVLSTVYNDISIYDTTFENPKQIKLPVPALNMFLIRKPHYQTLVTDEVYLYKLNADTEILDPIVRFKNKASKSSMYQDEHRIIVWTDKELIILEPSTLKVTEHFEFYKEVDNKFIPKNTFFNSL